MLRTISHIVTRMTTHAYKSPFRQSRYLHPDGSSKLPQGKSETIPETGEYAQSAPVNINHFKALIEPPNAVYRKRYRLRWDWHLRNFLMALMPPGALLICIKLIEWRFSGDMDKFGHLFPTPENLNEKLDDGFSDSDAAEGTAEGRSESRAEGSLKASLHEMLLQRMAKLEKEMANLRAQQAIADMHSLNQDKNDEDDGQHALIRAKKICETMVRQRRDSG